MPALKGLKKLQSYNVKSRFVKRSRRDALPRLLKIAQLALAGSVSISAPAPHSQTRFGNALVPETQFRFNRGKQSWKARPRPLGLRYGQDNIIPKQSSGTRNTGKVTRSALTFEGEPLSFSEEFPEREASLVRVPRARNCRPGFLQDE